MEGSLTIWLAIAAMTAAAIFAVLLPLSRPTPAAAAEMDVAVYKDQLAEIGRDAEAGLIGAAEAEAARVEVSRRLIAAAERVAAVVGEGATRRRRMVAVGAILIIPAVMLAFVIAFIGSVALWWLYFDRGAAAGREAITHTVDPGWLGLFAYSYFHLPMVAGIIAAAGGDELTIAYPMEPVTPAMMALILGGPALYLVGNALFTWALSGLVSWSRLVAIAALVALMPLAAGAAALNLLIAATLVLVALVGWDLRGR